MRMIDLEYLQWLQKNGKLYLIGMTVAVVALCGGGFYLLNQQPEAVENQQVLLGLPAGEQSQIQGTLQIPLRPSQEKETDQSAAAGQTASPKEQPAVGQEADQQPAEATAAIPQPAADGIAGGQVIAGVQEETKNEDAQDTEEALAAGLLWPEKSKQPTAQAVNPTMLPAYHAPCQGKIIGSFGMSYDVVYEDYRYHDSIVYQPSQPDVLAVWDGTITAASGSDNGTLVLENDQYIVTYQGLTATAHTNSKVTTGQVLGTAGERLTVKVTTRS